MGQCFFCGARGKNIDESRPQDYNVNLAYRRALRGQQNEEVLRP